MNNQKTNVKVKAKAVITKKCRWCGKRFKIENDGIFAPARRYCCDDCYNQAMARRYRRQMAG